MNGSKPSLRLIHGEPPAGGKAGNSSAANEPQSPQSPERKEFVDYLFERYRASLFRYINHLTPSREDAEEILQEAYIRILAVETLDMLEARARGYLFKIAANLVHDRIRKNISQSRDRHVSLNEFDITNQSPEPDIRAEWQESLKTIKQCLMSLTHRQRKVFLMHCIERLTNREIARVLKISTKTVERDLVLVLNLCQNKLDAQ